MAVTETANYPPITHGDPAPGSAGSTASGPERENRDREPDNLHSAITLSNRLRWLWHGFLTYFTPPSIFTDQPASLEDLATYAYEGGWTRRENGIVRGAGIWWYRLVGLPKTVANRYGEWIWQRPGRAIPVLLLTKLLASTSPGSWLVERVIKPVAHVIAWVLL